MSINVLSIGGGGGSSSGCTANSISPELKQYIQQQLAANGSVAEGVQDNHGDDDGTRAVDHSAGDDPARHDDTPVKYQESSNDRT